MILANMGEADVAMHFDCRADELEAALAADAMRERPALLTEDERSALNRYASGTNTGIDLGIVAEVVQRYGGMWHDIAARLLDDDARIRGAA